MVRFVRFLAPALLAALAVGCGADAPHGHGPGDKSKPTPAPVASAEGKKYLLDKEPAGVKGVIEVRKNGRDGDEVVVAGQVGGTAKPFTQDRAMFHIADTSLKPTEGCATPWDFCEYPKPEVAAARLSVKFADGAGKTIATDARELFGLRELTAVVVKGTLGRDGVGNVFVTATGMYVRPEAK